MKIMYEDKEYKAVRFQCDCYTPSCAIDVTIDKLPERCLTLIFWSTPMYLGQRLKWCWTMLRYGRGFEHEFVVRSEDIEDLGNAILKG